MYRYAESRGYDIGQKADISKFNDASSVSDFAQEAMEWGSYGTGIITVNMGKPCWTHRREIAPVRNVATIIKRFCERYGIG